MQVELGSWMFKESPGFRVEAPLIYVSSDGRRPIVLHEALCDQSFMYPKFD